MQAEERWELGVAVSSKEVNSMGPPENVEGCESTRVQLKITTIDKARGSVCRIELRRDPDNLEMYMQLLKNGPERAILSHKNSRTRCKPAQDTLRDTVILKQTHHPVSDKGSIGEQSIANRSHLLLIYMHRLLLCRPATRCYRIWALSQVRDHSTPPQISSIHKQVDSRGPQTDGGDQMPHRNFTPPL
jgi:hypothetical protein